MLIKNKNKIAVGKCKTVLSIIVGLYSPSRETCEEVTLPT